MVKPDFIVGILGNIVSILSFASPLGTFREVVKTKSSDNYDGLPYVSTLLSTSLWTFYGLLDPDDGILIVTVNSVGVTSQLVYLVLYLFYASKTRKMKYIGLVILDLVFLGTVMVITLVAFHGESRRTLVGVLCATFTIAMYGAPLSIVRTVIRTMSVEYMPFFLSLSLFVNASVWLTFALLVMDYYVLVPNAVGIVLGSLQLIVYFIYKTKTPPVNSVDMMSEDDIERNPNEKR
ncbi:OLC1v1001927C1 [Oldenlandia corymbosa var. corymbosa]|uniref:Bidirectional sugar transporter SWEET n=1 Tax=Oldenlandia corymbosa var. corymbosa TaxID=529605 RepID=A0AAV1D826_OLDCO|nr:OLC1v1001927C1 [Oldenlandia corymbosa var. corymbosa]